MKLLNMLVPALGILGWASAADAGTILKTTGTITGMDAFLAGAPTAVPTGSIAIGDKFTLTAKFDLSAAQIDPLYDANPALNIYYMPGTQVSLQIGSWTRTFTASSPNAAQIQLNDGPASDAQSFWLYDYNAASNLPVDMGAGFVIDGIFDFNRDPTGTARSNDLITQLVPLSAFSDRTLSVGFFNYNTLYMVGFHGQVEESSLITTPAPETASWMMMLGGASALSVPPCAIGVIPRRASPDTPPTQGVPATVHLIETELGNREVCRGAPDAEISAVSPGNYGASLLNSLLYARGIGRSSRFVDLVNWHRNPPMPPQAVARRHGQSRASTWRRRCGLYPHIAFRPFRFEPRLPPLTRCGYQ